MEISSFTMFRSEAARGERFHSIFLSLSLLCDAFALCEKNNETLHLKVNAKECKYLMSMEATTVAVLNGGKEKFR